MGTPTASRRSGRSQRRARCTNTGRRLTATAKFHKSFREPTTASAAPGAGGIELVGAMARFGSQQMMANRTGMLPRGG
jgi:hypothetical protein